MEDSRAKANQRTGKEGPWALRVSRAPIRTSRKVAERSTSYWSLIVTPGKSDSIPNAPADHSGCRRYQVEVIRSEGLAFLWPRAWFGGVAPLLAEILTVPYARDLNSVVERAFSGLLSSANERLCKLVRKVDTTAPRV
ncbi:hypothetical protein NMY22_g16807 [Coprinellus aureogranulatus]|nr:hypothetical protein NMY22_g16807 [Coprinellus aureogranulatus]